MEISSTEDVYNHEMENGNWNVNIIPFYRIGNGDYFCISTLDVKVYYYSDYGMLLQRWRSYIVNGHGRNKELIELVNKKGFDYIKANFKYSIIKNYNAKIDDHIIIEREFWWKETLQTRSFCYNSN